MVARTTGWARGAPARLHGFALAVILPINLCAWPQLVVGGCAGEGEPLVELDRRGPLLVASDPLPQATGVVRAIWPRLAFDEYLDAPLLRRGSVLQLRSGEHTAPATLRYDPVRRSLQLVPEESLLPLLLYRLTVVQPWLVQDLAGNALSPPEELVFATGEEVGLRPTLGPHRDSLRAQAQQLLDERCAGCHGAERAAGLPDLRQPELLIGRSALGRSGRFLVLPARPAESYLLHKVLPAYPDRQGAPMPRQGPQLSAAQLDLLVWTIERNVW